MRKWIVLCGALALTVPLLSGCDTVEQALSKVGDQMEAARLDTPTSGGDMDWSFVPVVREMAEQTFAAGFPEAEIQDVSVACKTSARVIVTLTYQMNGKTGTYGFDYEQDEQGGYVLTRYGDGVSSDDL